MTYVGANAVLRRFQSLKQLRALFSQHDERVLEKALDATSGCIELAVGFLSSDLTLRSPSPLLAPFEAAEYFGSPVHVACRAQDIKGSAADDAEDELPLALLTRTSPAPRASMRFARMSMVRRRRAPIAPLIRKNSLLRDSVPKRKASTILAAFPKRPRKKPSDRDHKVVFFPERFHRGSLNKLWRALRKAKKTLDVSVQYLSHAKLRHALLEARKNGARVRVIVDAGRDRSLDLVGRSELERAGIEVRIDQTARTMHHKFAVIDKSFVINGSLNWTNAVYQNMESVVISKSSSLAAAFCEEFQHLWLTIAAQVALPSKRARFEADDCEVLLFPDASKQNLQSFLAELRKTKRTLDVCVFSLWLREAVDTMCELHRRGVVVRVISDKRHAANHGGRLARRELQNTGIEYLVDKLCGEMHHKFAVLDSETVVCGSLNWSKQAVAGNTENIIFYRNVPSLASKFEHEFEFLRRKCRRPKSKTPELHT